MENLGHTNDSSTAPVSNFAIGSALLGIGILIFSFFYLFVKQKGKSTTEESDQKPNAPDHKPSQPTLIPQSKIVKPDTFKFTHPWLCASLRGHAKDVTGLDFSHNDKYLASTGRDEKVFLWQVKEFESRDHRNTQCNVELGGALNVKFSPDGRAFLINLINENIIRAYKFAKRDDGLPKDIKQVLDFSKKHEREIIAIGIASSGKFIMSASADTKIIIWDTKGEVLSSLETHQGHLNHASVSPCGRFFGSSGFTPDARFFEVCFDKTTGNFKEVRKAFDLKGHNASVLYFSLNKDSTRAATLSKDKTWKLYNTDVDYVHKQDAKCLYTGTFDKINMIKTGLIALSPDALSCVIAIDSNLYFYNLGGTEKICEQEIVDVHSESICSMIFDSTGKYLATAGDRQIRIFYNVANLKAMIDELSEKSKVTKQLSLKERIDEQIMDAREQLNKILNRTQ
ncbi:unnamed protein product [Didymodactylos carnosus]|uniref:Transducin beta-like protein 2 n=1 Tax=Didymodactylos carnosus TaxID=1234261 RepID=A0A815N706_9BILA|nr:unnamed protein product [Didymodactylos carnosus]CAF1433031.1 unnamed protein product [Didymodactylos carnosus]CAF4072594.1 unnamed protein product [Didymodactylos carnosus]CAF4311246.1 unnamed protein product [Didymodactylos carnosus]